MLGEPCVCTELDDGGKSGIGRAKCMHSGAEARGVEGVDGKGPVAALRAADAAGEEGSGAAGGIGERSVNDPDKLGIARGKFHEDKDSERGGEVGSTIACGPDPAILFGRRFPHG